MVRHASRPKPQHAPILGVLLSYDSQTDRRTGERVNMPRVVDDLQYAQYVQARYHAAAALHNRQCI